MSFVVHFLPAETAAGPDPLGAADGTRDADSSHELSTREIETWDALHPALTGVLPQGSHEVAANRYSRQLTHDKTGLTVTWTHGDYRISLPFWSLNASTDTFDTLVRLTEEIESATGLVGVDEISKARFLDHAAEVSASFAAIADGIEEAMERQTVLGWVRSLFHRNR